jgi:hypothetical protein
MRENFCTQSRITKKFPEFKEKICKGPVVFSEKILKKISVGPAAGNIPGPEKFSSQTLLKKI